VLAVCAFHRGNEDAERRTDYSAWKRAFFRAYRLRPLSTGGDLSFQEKGRKRRQRRGIASGIPDLARREAAPDRSYARDESARPLCARLGFFPRN